MQPFLQWEAISITQTEECFCSLRYPACNAHASYCHMWPASALQIFPHYLIKGKIFRKYYLA